MTGHPHFSKSFLGGSISTAASPLRSNFSDISCRSPVTPRRPSRYNGESSRPSGLSVDTETSKQTAYNPSLFLPTPRHFQITALAEESRTIYSADDEDDNYEDLDARSSITLVSPTAATRFLPHTPGLLYPSTNGSYVDPDAGKIGTFSAINIIIGKTVGVGVYSVPSSVFAGVGSVGMSILMWVTGAVISFCGLAVYLELGTALPKSGGERVYLERIFRRPHMLATCMFGAYVVLLGFSSPNCIVLGEYVMYALDVEPNRWNVRSVAVAVITLLCVVHARYQRLGLRIINVLGVSKMLILVIVILAGIAGMAMHVGSVATISNSTLSSGRLDFEFQGPAPTYNLSTAQRNFSNIWSGSSTQPYDYATALLKVLYCFRGYSTANQVLSSVRNPIVTLRRSAPIALALVSLGYVLANIAYFLAVEKDDFRASGVVVAGHFFKNVFGATVGTRVLPAFVVVSAFGNVAATSFAQARVNQELGADGLLPFQSFWQVQKYSLTTPSALDGVSTLLRAEVPPTRGLFLHWLVSVLVIVVPPPGHIYNFLVDIGGYPVSVISVAISLGLLYLQSSPTEPWSSPFRAKKIYTIVFCVANCFLLVLPWIRPVNGMGDGGRFVYFAYPATALGILGSGALYWVWWSWKGGATGRNGGSWTSSENLRSGRPKVHLSDLGAPLAMRRLKRYERSRRNGNGDASNEMHGQRHSLLHSHRRTGSETSSEGRSGSREDTNIHEVLPKDEEVEDEPEAGAGMRRRAPCGCPVDHGKVAQAADI